MADPKAPVVLKGLATILNAHTSFLALELVVRALVGVLKTSPSADVVYEDNVEVGVSGIDIGDECPKSRPAFNRQSAFAWHPNKCG